MSVHVAWHPRCLEHCGAVGHPERPERLRAIIDALQKPEWERRLSWHEAPEATRDMLLRVHSAEHIDLIRRSSERGGGQLDADTAVNRGSWEAALRAAGAAVRAVDIALESGGNAFAPVRPPGHHAETARAMGFCLFGNVVVAAREAMVRRGIERVLIVDWDVHHGNGTQSLVERDAGFRFVSLHQWPLYPGTGREDERGVGNVWNLPRPPGLPREHYVGDLLGAIDEATGGWDPDLVLISAGFDSMAGDPLGGFTLMATDYMEITTRLLALGAPVVGVLEGGYSLANLVAGSTALTDALA